MTTSMRLILTNHHPDAACAAGVGKGAEKLIEPCTQCKETGFADSLPINDDGMRTYGCAARS